MTISTYDGYAEYDPIDDQWYGFANSENGGTSLGPYDTEEDALEGIEDHFEALFIEATMRPEARHPFDV